MVLRELIHTAQKMKEQALDAAAIIRCRISAEESIFSHIERARNAHEDAVTQFRYIKNWGVPHMYRDVSILHEQQSVYGLDLNSYELQAFKGIRQGVRQGDLWTPATEAIKPSLYDVARIMDGLGIDRVYWMHFAGEDKLGEGYGCVLRMMEGAPSQYPSDFTGRTLYSAGLISLAEPEVLSYSAVWQGSHLKAIDEAITNAGLSPTVGHMGGQSEAKSMLRSRMQRMSQGVSSIEHS